MSLMYVENLTVVLNGLGGLRIMNCEDQAGAGLVFLIGHLVALAGEPHQNCLPLVRRAYVRSRNSGSHDSQLQTGAKDNDLMRRHILTRFGR